SQDSVIAVVPLGYGDGFFRLLTNRAQALVRGQRVPLVGTVCMDYIMLDMTKLAKLTGEILPKEQVVFWGEQRQARISADEVAEQAETIAYELFTAVSPRVPRRYRDGD
ncbi:MAG: alanine racemase, partial [Bdellovibrionales bacterium]